MADVSAFTDLSRALLMSRAHPKPSPKVPDPRPPIAYERSDGFVDAAGMMIYYVSVGQGLPLLVLHGGPGSSHDYFLPYLLPLASHRQLIFIDERGCGRSGRLSDPTGYTLEHMVEDVEAVRKALNLGRVALLGHSFGGILAQAYAIKYQKHLSQLILAGTAHSAVVINAEFECIKGSLPREMREQIEALEREGIYASDGAYRPEYAKLAAEAQRPYNFIRPAPASEERLAWDVLREMWVRRSDFVLDGNLSGFDFSAALEHLRVPTLIVVGDHDLVRESTAEAMCRIVPGSKLLVMRGAAHMMFVDQPESFLQAVEAFCGHESDAGREIDVQPGRVNTSSETERALDTVVEHALREGPYPGLAVIVERAGSVVYVAARGLADLENELPVTRETVFPIASVTKTFSALGLLQLVAKDDLSLDASIGRYLSEVPEPFAAVPLRALLTHTSGIPEYTSVGLIPMTSQQDVSPAHVLSTLRGAAPLFPVGARFNYSNTDNYIVGLLIEKLSGSSYRDFLIQQVFKPFGMDHTFYADYRDIIPHRARGYTFGHELLRFQGAMQYSATIGYASGGLQSTLDDLLGYSRGLRTLTTEAVRRLMLEADRLADGTPNYYTLGCLITREFAGHSKLSHPGNIYGFSAALAIYPDDDLTVIVLGNSENPRIPPSSIECALARVALGVSGASAQSQVLVPGDLAFFAGTYGVGRFRFFADTFEFTVKDGQLWFQEHGEELLPPVALRYRGDRCFSVEFDAEHRFAFAGSGEHADVVRREYDGMYFDAHYLR